MMHRIKLLGAAMAVAAVLGVSGTNLPGISGPAPSSPSVQADSSWQATPLNIDSGWQ